MYNETDISRMIRASTDIPSFIRSSKKRPAINCCALTSCEDENK